MASEAFSTLVENIRKDFEDCLVTLCEMRGSDRNCDRSAALQQLNGMSHYFLHSRQYAQHSRAHRNEMTDNLDKIPRAEFDAMYDKYEELTLKHYQEMDSHGDKGNAGTVQ